jgi:hypothetical protein
MRPVGSRARRAPFVFLALVAAMGIGSMFRAAASDAVGEFCYVVADHTAANWDDDMLSRADTGVFNPASNETTIGVLKGLNIEAIALKPNTDPPVLYAFSGGILGTLNTTTAVFSPIGALGSGTGSLGTIKFTDTDGMTFDPHTGRLYASIRRSGPDLLVEVNPVTGARVLRAFGAADYVVVQQIAGLSDIDDISIGGRVTDVLTDRFPMWAIANEGGNNPRLIKINRSGDVFTGAATDVGATLVKDIEGLSWGNTGLWATTGKSNNVEGIWQVNPSTGLATSPRVLDNAIDYESIACPPPAVLKVTVGPKTGLNQTSGQHTFNIAVTRDADPAQGVVPAITMTGVGSVVSNGCASGTNANGVCSVTVSSTDIGLTTLNATVTTSVGQSTIATKSDFGSTRWIDLAHTAPCTKAPVGSLIPFTVTFTTGESLSGVTVNDSLPSQLVFDSASAIGGVMPVTPPAGASGGLISWTFPNLPAGTHTGLIKARVAVGVPANSQISAPLSISHGGNAVDVERTIEVITGRGLNSCALPLEINVLPKLGLKLLQEENAFTVTLLRDGVPAIGAHPRTDLVSTGVIDKNTCADEGTDATGTCRITVKSLLVGTGVLTASYEMPVGDKKITATDTGSMIWVGLDKGLPCLGAPLGALVPYTVSFSVGHDLDDVTVTDVLPGELIFQSAGAINGVAPIGPQSNQSGGGTVSWTFDHLPAGNYTGRVYARVGLDVIKNTKITNVLKLTHGGLTVERSRTVDVLDIGLDQGLPQVCALPLQIKVLPKLGLDLLGDTHVFTVDLLLDGKPAAGLKPTISILGTPALLGTIENNSCESAGTDANGRCSVTIKSSLPGTAVLTASYELPVGTQTLRVADVGTMVWVGLSKDTLCLLSSAPPTTPIPYKISFKVGADLNNVTVTDRLPSQLLFVSAGSINGVKPTTPSLGASGGLVSWHFGKLPAGEYSGLVNVVLSGEALPGLRVNNVVEFVLDKLSVEQSRELTVIKPDAVIDALAYGIKTVFPGRGLVQDIKPTPSTAESNHAELTSVANPLGGSPLVRALHVSEFDSSTPREASATAIASAGSIDVNIPGVVRVEADGAIARSTSAASLVNATSTAAGSTVKNLRINGAPLGDVSEPTTLVIRDPLTRVPVAEVRVLERIASGAAANEKQPADGSFRSGLEVNAIHVVVLDLSKSLLDESGEVIVGHTQSSARFTSGIGCLDDLLKVIGRGVVADLLNLAPELPRAVVGEVRLPLTGGAEREQLASVTLPVGTAGSSSSETSGVVSIPDQRAETNASARISDLMLLDGAIRADLVEAITSADLDSPAGEARLGSLVIGGFNACGSADAACAPAADTSLLLPGPGGPVLVVLNEQVHSPHGITVNAVHIYVLGNGNSLGLPAGAELIIGQAQSAALHA